MKVCIAEKPSVAKEIAKVLGADKRLDGYYEGQGYQVTWTFGHFCSLLSPEDYFPQWKRWDIYALPMLPKKFETKIIEDGGVKKQFRVIQSLLNKADVVINCGDAGQEGELIQRWVINKAEYQGPVERLWISSLTTEAIKEGFQNLKPASDFDNLYYAGSSRAIGDWLLGINATRLYTIKYGGYKQVISIGRVQTPTLAMLVQRHLEIQNFTPEPYWELQTLYREAIFKHSAGKFEQKEDGEKILEAVKDSDLEITEIEQKEGKEYAPKLFDLTSLQVHCNNKFGFTADTTLKIIQRLYEKKLVTYPRVDTTFLPNDMYPKIPGILKGLRQYSSLTTPLMGKKIRKSTKVFNDKKVTDHHAIIPTGEEMSISGDELKVYDSVVRRFLAVFYPDCKVAKTTVNAVAADIEFVAKGKEILDEGWRVVFAKDQDDKEDGADSQDDDGILPKFEKGEKGPHEPSFIEKMTKAPNNYSEATLLRAMETAGKQVDDEELRELMKANGIGRPSTRASIIETLFKRGYAMRNKKQVLPTDLGVQLIGLIQNQLLKSAELTGQWEKQLKEIEDGSYSPVQFIHEMKKMVYELVVEVKKEPSAVLANPNQEKTKKSKAKPKSASANDDLSCPKCKQGKLLKGKSALGCERYGKGCDFLLPFSYKGKKISEKQLFRIAEKGSSTLLKGFKEGESKVDGKLILGEDFKLILEQKDKPAKASKSQDSPKCPKCGTGNIIKGKTAYGCSEWQKGCDFRFSFSDIKQKAAGRALTKELVMEIIST